MMRDINLPEGWILTKFTDVVDVQGGTQPPKSQFIDSPKEGYVRLLQIRDFGAKPVPTYIPDTTKLKKCVKSDLLIGRYGASLGRICSGMEGSYNVALAKVISGNYLCKLFLKAYLESEMFQQPLALLSRSAQNGFNKDDLATFDFAIPPLAEQKVIADKLDTLLVQVENTKARLERIPTILKTFRQSVLAAAVSGKLTEEWRKFNKSKFPYESCQLLEIIQEMRNGLSPKPNEQGRGHPILRISAVRPFILNQDDIRHLEISEKDQERYSLKSDDLLFTRYNGSIEYVGVCARVTHIVHNILLYPDKIIRVRVDKEKVNAAFLEIVAASHEAREYIFSLVKSTSGQKGISGQDLKLLKVKLPSVSEQTEIVRRVEQLFAFADSIEQKANAGLARVNNLTQSILAKAFRGELTADWRAANPGLISGENSAEALLEKIKAERGALKATKPTRGRKQA